MYITGLKKEHKKLSSVFIDEAFWHKIDNDVLVHNRVKIGTVVDDEFLSKLQFESDYNRAKEKALYLLSFRDYSKKELCVKLKKDYCLQAVEKAILRMEELGFINDNLFAQKYAKKLLFNKHFSKRKAEFELLQKGIDKDTICEILENLEYNAVEQIRILVNKKYNQAYIDEKIKKRAVAFLQRHGFSWDDIKQVLDF